MVDDAPALHEVRLSAHAAEQYRHRVTPGLDLEAARAELEQLRLVGEITSVEPAWLNAAKPAPHYILISDALAPPLVPHNGGWIATTCVANCTVMRRGAARSRLAEGRWPRASARGAAQVGRAMAGVAAAQVNAALEWRVLALLIATAVGLHLRRRRERRSASRLSRLLHPLRVGVARGRPPATSGSTSGAALGAEPHSSLSSTAIGSSEVAVPGASARRLALRDARHPPVTLELLAQNVDQSRRLAFTEARVSEILAGLPRDR